MAEQYTSVVLTFEDTEFDAVDIHCVPWLRGFQIGCALRYKNPSSDMAKLYECNADEFTPEMTQILDLPTAEGIQQVRVFSPRGCYLLAILSRTEKSKVFRAWVLDVLEGRIEPRQSRPLTINQTLAVQRLCVSLMEKLVTTTDSGLRDGMYAQLSHASRLLNVPVPSLVDLGRTVELPPVPWQWAMRSLLSEISLGRYKGRFCFDKHHSADCLMLRISEVIAHFELQPELRPTLEMLPVRSDRTLKRELLQAGVVIGEVERTIDGCRVGHLAALSLERLDAFGLLPKVLLPVGN